MWILEKALAKRGLYWIVTPTYGMGKDIHWKQGFNDELPRGIVAKRNETELEITLVNGSRIGIKSAEHPARLKGVGLEALVVDEIAQMRDWDAIWSEALRPTLTDRQAPALFISTPVGYNHFYELWKQGQGGNKNWRSWTFTSYDNPYVPREEIDSARIELDEDIFAQEYLAEFKKFSGMVYKDFSRAKHVIEPIEIGAGWPRYRAIDFGFINPSGVLFAAIGDNTLYIYDEIYQAGLQTPELASLIKQKSAGTMFSNTFADSAQAADIAELVRYGVGVVPVRKAAESTLENWVAYKVRRVAELIKTDRLKIFNNCLKLIWEIENYRYMEVGEGQRVKEVPAKVNDHLCDALAYLVCSLPQQVIGQIGEPGEEEYNIPEIKGDFRIGR